MLEFFRRHRGAFLITVTVIIIISFSVWGGWKSGRDSLQAQPTDPAFEVYGRTYTIAEAQRLSRRMQVIYMLQLFDLLSGLSRSGGAADVAINQVILQREMDRLGVTPSDAEAKAALEKLPVLMENGTFSQQRAYNAEQMLGAYGFNGNDMLEIMKLSVGLGKLRNLAGGNYVAGPLEVEKSYASEHQTLKIATIAFQLEDYKKSAKIGDEEITKYYEENKETYKTAEKRALRYVFFENPKEQEDVPLEERQKRQRDVVERVNKFNDAAIAPGAKFETIVKQLKETEQKTELFTRDNAPEALKNEAELLEVAFAINPQSRPISDPVKGSNGYYIFTVSQVEEPKQQELAEVKDQIRETLVAQKAQEGLTQAVNDAREALNKGLSEGKKIADLAKELKLKLSPVSELTPAEPPADLTNAYEIVNAVRSLPAGGLSASIDTETGALLAYVESKELRKRDNAASLRDNLARTRANMDQRRLFDAWFGKLRDAAKPRVLIRETGAGA
jgi:parvulin-like peptidyl-prolyl isomerase